MAAPLSSSPLRHLTLLLLFGLGPLRPSLATPLPPLDEILNPTRVDVRSARGIPRPGDVHSTEVRRDAPLRQAFRTGPRTTRLVRIALWQAYWTEGWTPDESLTLNLYDGDHRLLGKATEPYSLRQWEGAIHEFQLEVPVQPDHPYEFELSVEGGDGIIPGLALTMGPPAAGVGGLTRAGAPLPGAIWFQTHVKYQYDREALYQEVFDHFDLARPDMSHVKAAVQARDWDTARRELIAHFEGRSDLVPPTSPAPAGVKASTRAEADLAVAGKVRAANGEIVDLGPRWNHLTTWKTRGGVGLTRSGLRGLLAHAYEETRDETYARAWNEMLRFQFYDLPSPLRSGVIPSGSRDIPPVFDPDIGGGSMWAALSIGARMAHGFTYYRRFVRSPSFEPDTRFAFLANLAEMSDVLPLMKGGGNWEAQRTTALFDFAQEFPEFKGARQWLADGFAGAVQSCLENTYPDGPLREATFNYHNLSLNRYLGILEKAQSVRLAPPLDMRVLVEKMLEYVMYSTMPDGQLPLWGDTNPPIDGDALLARGAAFFHRDDMLWVASHGKQGQPPVYASARFPKAGYFIMRSGWDPAACFLALHNGHSSAHGHADQNSLVLTAGGRQLIIDPGVYIYGTAESAELHRSLSHNTVTMDDMDTANDGGPARFIPGVLMDVYDGASAGYEGLDRSARHRRRVVFAKPDAFLIVDDTRADQPHDWTLRFHLASGQLTPSAAAGSLTFLAAKEPEQVRGRDHEVRLGRAGLSLTAAEGANPSVGMALAADGWEKLTHTPVASWKSPRVPNAHFASLLAPFSGATRAALWTVGTIPGGGTVAYRAAEHGAGELLFVNGDPGQAAAPSLDIQDFSCDAGVALVRRTIDGKAVEALALLNGANLSWSGIPPTRHSASSAVTMEKKGASAGSPLVSALQPVERLEATWKGSVLSVSISGGNNAHIRSFGARWLSVNGLPPVPIPPGTVTVTVTG